MYIKSKNNDRNKGKSPIKFSNSIDKITNIFIKNVTNNIDNFSYNKIIANFHEIYSSLTKEISNKIEKNKLIENYKNINYYESSDTALLK